jgi:hypothetical protein
MSQNTNDQGRFVVIKTRLSQRQLKQVPELIILTNSKSFENLKLKRKKKRGEENI